MNECGLFDPTLGLPFVSFSFLCVTHGSMTVAVRVPIYNEIV
jgi:hypothetical protein